MLLNKYYVNEKNISSAFGFKGAAGTETSGKEKPKIYIFFFFSKVTYFVQQKLIDRILQTVK